MLKKFTVIFSLQHSCASPVVRRRTCGGQTLHPWAQVACNVRVTTDYLPQVHTGLPAGEDEQLGGHTCILRPTLDLHLTGVAGRAATSTRESLMKM